MNDYRMNTFSLPNAEENLSSSSSPNNEFFVFGLIVFVLIIAILTLFTLNKYTKLLQNTYIGDLIKRIDNGLKKKCAT